MTNQQQYLLSLNQRVEARAQAIREGQDWWPCKRGCDYCCRHLAHLPELSAPEWERVDAAIAQLPSSERAIVEQQIHTLLQHIAEHPSSAPIVCPYLNEAEGACRIYDSRPIACRTYGFFVARDHHQYCQQIETEISNRGEDTIVWGNASAIHHELKQVCGIPISFEQHYGDRACDNAVSNRDR